MGDNVITLHEVTTMDIPPERVLSAALETEFEQVFVMGVTKDGDLYEAGSTSDMERVLFLIERWKHLIMKRQLEWEDDQ